MKQPLLVMQLVLGQFLVGALVLTALPHLGVIPLGENPDLNQSLEQVLLMVGGALIVFGFLIRRYLLKSLNETTKGLRNGAAQISTSTGTPAGNPVFVPTMLSFALFEGAAVVGFVIALLSGRTDSSLLLGAAACVSMLTCWPTQSLFNKYARHT